MDKKDFEKISALLDEKLRPVREELEIISSKIKSFERTQVALIEIVDRLKDRVSLLNEKVKVLEEKVDELDQKVDAHTAPLMRIEKEIGFYNEDARDIKRKFGEYEKRLQEVEAELSPQTLRV